MSNWSKCTLRELIIKGNGFIQTGPFGSQLHVSDYVDEGIPIIMPVNLKDNRIDISKVSFISENDSQRLAKHLVKTGDIIYSRRGDVTQKALITRKEEGYFCGTGCLLIRPENSIDPNFLVYFLSTPRSKAWIINNAVGITMPNLNTKILNSFPISYPEQKEQKQIAKVLSDLDAKIAINNKINTALEAMAKTLYDYWFVQFDFPDKNRKPYKSSEGKMIFNEDLKREIPVGWEVDNLSSWIKNDKSGDWGKETEQGNYVNKVSCIRGADLNGINGKGSVKSPTRFVLEKNSHKLLEIGDFIIEISGGSPTQSTGRMACITKETLERFENPLICSNFCKAVTLKDEKSLYNFAYEWNRIYDAGVLFGWEGKTSGIKNLLFESFVTNHKLSKPNSDIMEQFYAKAKPIHAQIQKNLIQNQKLSELRDWLLPMLMNGQVRVGE